ncbi:MAG: prephenate dehydratase [Sclerophora amabilis]|nr:MAG: prephenate dehydratase [Sclerophora amabilis]
MENPKPSVAYLGPESSYSHQATLECFDSEEYTFKPQVHIQDIFEAVQAGHVSRGVVPFENSTNGSVVYTLDLFADRQRTNPDVFVCGEAYLDVHHHLLGHSSLTASPIGSGDATPTANVPAPSRPRATPLASLDHVNRVYSHPQAFGQCESFLSTYLKGVERHEVSSTSKAAQIVAQDPTKTSAAISSKIAARVHGLNTLARGIEDREDNTTRFLILRKGVEDFGQVKVEKSKSLVSFTIDHCAPGALAEALTVFKEHALNLTSINSRPSRLARWNYIFFVEFSGDGVQLLEVAFGDLQKVTTGWRWLGTWKDELNN